MLQRNGTSLLERSASKRTRRPSRVASPTDLRHMSTDALFDLADRLEGAPVPGVTMTEAEFVEWRPETLRAEWVDGKVILMSPSNVEHDELSVWLIRLLGEYVESHNLGPIFQNVFVRFPVQRR